MKIYLIYKIYEALTPILYAFTEDKNILNDFKSERNMNIFKVKEKTIDKENFERMRISHHDYLLGRKSYITKALSSYSLTTSVKIVSTDAEEFSVFVQSDRIGKILGKYTDPIFGEIVNDKIMKELNNLYYYSVIRYGDEECIVAAGATPLNDYLYNIDQLSVFMMLYGDTMVVDKFDDKYDE